MLSLGIEEQTLIIKMHSSSDLQENSGTGSASPDLLAERDVRLGIFQITGKFSRWKEGERVTGGERGEDIAYKGSYW